MRGFYGVPLVAFDGTTEGLSADRGVLVLAGLPDGRPTRTRFVALDARNLRIRRSFSLRGRFAFDALSPEGETLYLVQHLSAHAPRYVVRAYDIRSGRLFPGVIRDRRERDRTMHGYPLARATSADGRWAYTLYAQPEVHAFVHALDTVAGRARCIDLPGGRRSLAAVELKLSDDGRELVALSDAGERVAVVARSTLLLRTGSETSAPSAAPARGPEPPGSNGGEMWAPVGAGAGVLLAAGLLARRRTRRR